MSHWLTTASAAVKRRKCAVSRCAARGRPAGWGRGRACRAAISARRSVRSLRCSLVSSSKRRLVAGEEVDLPLLVEVAGVAGEPAAQEGLVLGLDVGVDAVELPVDVDEGVVGARGGQAGGAEQVVRQPLGQEGGVLEQVVQGQPAQAAEALVGHEGVELDLEGRLARQRPQRRLPLEPHAHVLDGLVAVAEGPAHVVPGVLPQRRHRRRRQLDIEAGHALGIVELVAGAGGGACRVGRGGGLQGRAVGGSGGVGPGRSRRGGRRGGSAEAGGPPGDAGMGSAGVPGGVGSVGSVGSVAGGRHAARARAAAIAGARAGTRQARIARGRRHAGAGRGAGRRRARASDGRMVPARCPASRSPPDVTDPYHNVSAIGGDLWSDATGSGRVLACTGRSGASTGCSDRREASANMSQQDPAGAAPPPDGEAAPAAVTAKPDAGVAAVAPDSPPGPAAKPTASCRRRSRSRPARPRGHPAVHRGLPAAAAGRGVRLDRSRASCAASPFATPRAATRASGASAPLHYAAPPRVPGAAAAVRAGARPGGGQRLARAAAGRRPPGDGPRPRRQRHRAGRDRRCARAPACAASWRRCRCRTGRSTW